MQSYRQYWHKTVFFYFSFYKRISLLSVCVCNVIDILKFLKLFSCNVELRCLNLLHSWISIKIWEVGDITIIMVKWKIFSVQWITERFICTLQCIVISMIILYVYQYFLPLVFWNTFSVQYFEHLTNWNTCLSYIMP